MSEAQTLYNIYCDESCHLLNDQNKTLVLGAVWAEEGAVSKAFEDIRKIKENHGLPHDFESKWTKVSAAKADFYCALVDYFFENPDLHFRAVVVPDKTILDHSIYSQDHDTWYYKMFYVLLNVIVGNDSRYNLYLDIKDTKSHEKVLELKRILNIATVEDISISKAQQVRSHEIELMQLVDLLIGALSYKHRSLDGNEGKVKVVDAIENNIGEEVLTSSAKNESKFNVLVWKPTR